MAAWSDGYFTDIQYTANFYPQLAPGFMAFACLRQGVRAPPMGAGATYLELGCGQGFGLNLLAAANPAMDFIGVDFHPGQIDNAVQLARAAGLANATFHDLSFEQVLALPEGRIPRCEVIALHGVYSWVTAENRVAILRLLDRLLKPGGMAFVSYNCLPGWAALIPLQRFVAGHVAQSTGDPKLRVIAALQAAQQMAADKAQFFTNTPSLKPAIEQALRQNHAYLVHEYLNEGSEPRFHADVAREMATARLTYAATANAGEDMIRLAAPKPLQQTIRDAADPLWRETLLDYASNKLFRRDIYIRGPNALAPSERDARLAEARLALLAPPAGMSFDFRIPMGKLTGDPKVYGAIVEALADGPRSYGELAGLPALAQGPAGVLLQAIALLIGARKIHPVAEAEVAAGAAVAFNRAVLSRLPLNPAPGNLASPLIGSGVAVDYADLLAISALMEGETDTRELPRRGAEALARAGAGLQTAGKALSDPAEVAAELAGRMAGFETRLPRYRQLGVV
jgi:SAM-dependent methyltransferase